MSDRDLYLCAYGTSDLYLCSFGTSVVTPLYARFKGYLDKVEIVMNNKNGCEKIPHMDMDEHCKCF